MGVTSGETFGSRAASSRGLLEKNLMINEIMFISHRRPSSRSLEKPNMPNNEEVMRVTKSFKNLQTVCKFTDRKHRSSREHGSKGDVYPAHVSWQKYYCRVEDQKIKIGTRRRSVFFLEGLTLSSVVLQEKAKANSER